MAESIRFTVAYGPGRWVVLAQQRRRTIVVAFAATQEAALRLITVLRRPR